MFKRISKLALAVAFMVSGLSIDAYAQATATRPAPQCRQAFSLSAVSATTTGTVENDNRPVIAPGTFDKGGCDTWTLEYHVTGFSASAFQVNGAPDVSGAAGTYQEWVAAGGSMITGTFPVSSTTQGTITFKNYIPWVQVVLNSKTGTGSVTGVLYGWVTNPNSNITLTGAVSIDVTTLAKETGGNLAAIASTAGAKADAKSTATDTTPASMVSILKQISASVQAPPTQAVTATLGAETTKIIGTVNIASGQAVSISGVPHVVVDSGGGGGSTAQGATTSGVTGGLSMGMVTTGAPSYTNGTINGISLGLLGGLRTEIISGPAITYNSTQPTLTDGQTAPDFQLSNRGELKVAPGVSGFAVTNAVIGTLTDAKSTATDATSTSLISINKQISASVQALAGGIVYNSTQPTLTNGQTASDVQITSRGEMLVSPGVSAFPTQATPTAATTGGATNYPFEVAASDNHQVAKNGAGQVYWIHSFSKHTADMYIRLYNAGTGFSGCGSATNLVWEGQIPGSATGAGFVTDIAVGMSFSTGISVCVTGAYGNTDTTSATASVASVNIGYK
jgi:hypothetical protein